MLLLLLTLLACTGLFFPCIASSEILCHLHPSASHSPNAAHAIDIYTLAEFLGHRDNPNFLFGDSKPRNRNKRVWDVEAATEVAGPLEKIEALQVVVALDGHTLAVSYWRWRCICCRTGVVAYKH